MKKFFYLTFLFLLPIYAFKPLNAKTLLTTDPPTVIGYYEAFIQGLGNGINVGHIHGWNNQSYSPKPPSNYFLGDAKQGFEDGYKSGYDTGYREGLQARESNPGGSNPFKPLPMRNE